ncbi:hypothetical protein [Streptomyces camelliae]|uniref:Uncharacterized protein n=1 Tax=Streptomyces camelliae TaxID=3004093 RepID=A0ABY7P585_9ACTN|nr:hypothetical protein [Streptomyces sp. HUAS 2-6]WBO64872.1 hypothetical protein O1G22_19560 [Streptomyces sp. HUAS 2-6]
MPKDPAPSPGNAADSATDSAAATGSAYEDWTDEDEHEAPEPVVETAVEDDLFGAITVRLDTRQGEVTVEGESVPRVVLRRTAGTEAADHIPVGTRDGTLLTLTVDGEEAAITPAKGRLTRRSYRVDVDHAGHGRRLVPDSIPGSRLLRDEQHVGDFTSGGDGRVQAEWREDTAPNATDAALGYALAAAFGTGAQPMWMIAIEMIGDMIPG